MSPTSNSYISVSEAAQKLGVSPWEVIRLTESGRVGSVVLVEAASLSRYVEETTR